MYKSKLLNFVKVFFLLAFGLFAFPFPLYTIPGFSIMGEWIQWFYGKVITQVGLHLFSIENLYYPNNGSGDTAYNWIGLGLIITLAFIGSTLATLYYSKDKLRAFLNESSILFFRYYLAYNMIYYGLVKFYRLQFPELSFDFLTTELSDATPLNLMWFFFGYSNAYNIYLGVIEVCAGGLLFFRKTTLLGSLVSLVVMLVIVPMNFVFNVPVKLYASHILLAAILLTMYLGKNLPEVLIGKHKSLTPPTKFSFLKLKPKFTSVLKVLVIGSLVYYNFKQMHDWKNRLTWLEKDNAAYGLFEIVEDRMDTPSPYPGESWRYIIVEDQYRICIKNWNGEKKYVSAEVGEGGILYLPSKEEVMSELSISPAENGLYSIQGKIGEDAVQVLCKKLVKEDFTLMSRQVKLISPRPDHNDI